MNDKVKLLMNLRALRKEAGLSLDFVVSRSGINKSILSRMEIGEAPGLVNALRMARFLNTPVEQIWGLTDEKGGE